MNELTLSIFADESGGQNETSKYYLLMLVLHDQSLQVALSVEDYKNSLNSKGLLGIPLRASPLICGKENTEFTVSKNAVICKDAWP